MIVRAIFAPMILIRKTLLPYQSNTETYKQCIYPLETCSGIAFSFLLWGNFCTNDFSRKDISKQGHRNWGRGGILVDQ